MSLQADDYSPVVSAGSTLWAGMILSAVLAVAAPAAHADLGVTNMSITATLVANTCTVSADSKDKTVDMGTWATKQFAATPKGVPPVRFVLNLENCGGAASGVAVSFNGTADKDDNSLLALNTGSGAATNLGIAILDKDRNRIPLGEDSNVYPISAGATSVPLVFYGQYVASNGKKVTPGTGNADATFTLNYQ
ncbi:fimbrial protein [Serratia rubidaea]|uniref:fimbrial protein n=1 Tax=Serratia rubidaea TaxID=61652 RepID=UPI0023AE80B6|nr:fimbrial protein [Serratia rubidaea]MDK1705088.1 fimbrial protein [Serratia rubidaea]